MELIFLLKGIVIGISIAAPVGPIGILCIRRTLAEGRLTGLVSGLGAATADAVYGSIAGFGLTFISQSLVNQQNWLRLIGGLFLCYLGIKTLLSKPTAQTITRGRAGLLGAYASTFFLTLTNPMTILAFTAIFAGLGLVGPQGDYRSAALLVLGVFSGSAIWWLVLSGSVSLLSGRFTLNGLQWINRASGVILLGFGLYAITGLI